MNTTKMNKRIRLLLLPPCMLITASGLFAQTASSSEINDENVITLSPFEVTGDNDVGYQATSTLAGTRLRTDLRDVGSSISIVNEEFLRDTGSQNIEDVLIFTPNTEIGGLGGNHSGSQGASAIPEQQRDDPSGGLTRVRGLASADLTRDYFLTNIPFDTFNTDRVEVQRGANSALYGLGSPGGIVNASTIKADFLGNRGRARFETDQYGTARYSMRHNQMIGDHVAVRIAALSEDKGFEQKQAFMEDNRLFGAVTVKLPLNLTVRGSAEIADRHSSNPDYIPPNDAISPWINFGKPIVATPSDGGRLFRTTGDFIPGVVNNRVMTLAASGTSSGLSRFYQDPSNPESTYGGPVFIRAGELPNPWASATPSTTGEWMYLQPRTETDIIRLNGVRSDGTPVAEGTAGFYNGGFVSNQILDRSIYDYRENLFSGGMAQQKVDWENYSASIEGNYFDNRVGFTMSYNEERFYSSGNNSLQGNIQRSIFIDPNAYLLNTVDGTATGGLVPNPTFGRPVMSGPSGGNKIQNDRDSTRLQGYAEVRFDDFMNEDSWMTKLLGKFTLTGLLDESTHFNETQYSARSDPLEWSVLTTQLGSGDENGFVWPAQRSGQLFALPVGDNSFNFLTINSINDLAGVGIQGVSHGRARSNMNGNVRGTFTGFNPNSDTFNTFDSRVNTIWEEDGFNAASHANKRYTTVESEVFVGQHALWDNTLVLTGTWRSDKATSTGIGVGNLPAPRRDVKDVYDPVYVAGPQVQGPHPVTADDESTSYSIMLHTPPFLRDRLPFELSIYKSKADNFIPGGGNVDIYNRPIGATSGATEEMGFIIEGLDGKLSARFNWYESGVLNNRFENSAVSAPAGILLSLAQEFDNPANVAQGFTVSQVQAILPPQGVIDVSGFVVDWNNPEAATIDRNSSDTGTQDFTSEGMEVEIAYNPIPEWTLLFTAGQQETVASNTFPVMQDFLDTHVLPQWINSSFAQNYFVNDAGTQTLAELAQTAIVENVQRGALQDGNPAKEQAEWRFAFNTSYNFGANSEIIPKWFGNLTVGGGLRWQDEVGIGFKVARNSLGDFAQDINQAFYADSTTHLDLFARMSYKLKSDRSFDFQINIKDATNHDGLIPFIANPDGSLLYRISEGRLISASATLSF
jgi:outer membrane receptor protein involved in Fe transport